ncbi:CynX/NimT family MFS transporter [Piscibacillus sp. B03]|uniref:CynX/NimT family MFS transporter n=1 Tax=Piscibacillus sp. B03 TaxID=3457430 RepID=UPI003FCDDEDA
MVLYNQKLKNAILIAGIVFVAFNLRPSITAVGPVISDIRMDTGMSNGVAGLLTTVPLLAFALLSPLAPKIAQRFGNEWTVFMGLILLGIGITIRPTTIVGLLFFGTLLVGAGIAVCNVLLPGIVKNTFVKVGLITGAYTLSMNFMASLGSGISVPLAHGLNLGWKKGLLFWGIFTVIALVAWIPQLRKKEQTDQVVKPNPAKGSLLKSKIAWQVTLFMGLQSFLFYCLIAWLPEILVSRGLDISTAGWMVSIMQIAGLPTAFLAPYLADRYPNQRGIIIVLSTSYILGLLLLLFGSNIFVLSLSILFAGASQGASIALSLALLSLRARDAKQAANLSGMAQSIGYLLAAIGPFTVGVIFDLFSSWTPSLVLFIIIATAMFIAGLGAGKDRYVTPEES